MPYRRVLVMHVTIIASGFLLTLLTPGGLTRVVGIVIVLVKTVLDVAAHAREHAVSQRAQ